MTSRRTPVREESSQTISVQSAFGVECLPAFEALSLVAQRLVPAIQQKALSPRVGKFAQNSAGAEVGIYLDEGPLHGAAVLLRSKPAAFEVVVAIVASSKLTRALTYAAFGLGVVLGYALGFGLSAGTFEDWRVSVFIGLACALALGIGLLVVSSRIVTPSKRSRDLASRLRESLAPAIGSLG